jgi:hypothetical protein
MVKEKLMVGVMLRCHRRARALYHVLSELRRYRGLGIEIRIHALLDRPTPEVKALLEIFSGLIRTRWYPDFVVLSKVGGERFREAKMEQFEQIKAWPERPDWVLLQDDDRWFEPLGATEELPKALADPNVDMWYARSLFVWDKRDQINVRRKHNSPVLFRCRNRDQYPLDRDVQAPVPLHDEAICKARTGLLETPLLDYGTFSQEERDKTFNAFWEARKRDKYVYSIQEEPELISVDEILKRPWNDLWEEEK